MQKEHSHPFDKPHFGGSRTDTLIKLTLIFFIALLSFSVGTYVGKQFSDSEHRLSQLETEYSTDLTSISERSEENYPKTLTETDIESLANEFTTEEAIEPITIKDLKMDRGNKRVPAASDEDKESEKTISIEEEQPTNEVSLGQMPNHIALEDMETPHSYTVQIASYENSENAIRHANELKEKGYDALIMQAEIRNKTWYRITLGVFPVRSEALHFMKKIKAELNLENALIQKIFVKPNPNSN